MEAGNESAALEDESSATQPTSPKRSASPSIPLQASPSKRAETESVVGRKESKIIHVNLADGRVETVQLGSDRAFQDYRSKRRVICLITANGITIYDFDDLVHGETYALGDSAEILQTTLQTKVATFPYDSLNAIESIRPPPLDDKEPEFVSNAGWLDQVASLLSDEFRSSDSSRPHGRVQPMALVGCSRSGKTRALKELARHLKQVFFTGVIFVSFNDYSQVTVEDEEDPLQALCKRIAFEGLCAETTLEGKRAAYNFFDSEKYVINPNSLRHWLGASPVILFIDELNSLKSATTIGTNAARRFGDFVRRTFLVDENRYTVFSTHALSTLDSFVDVVDSSASSDRRVMLQSLPLIPNLAIARENLCSRLQATDAIYYGLLPAMIFTQPEISAKQANAVSHCNSLAEDEKVHALRGLLRSLFTGDIADVPKSLHNLLVTRSSERSKKVSWVPFLLEFVLRTLTFLDSNLNEATTAMADLLRNFKHARKGSGNHWENLFTFQLMARCFAHQADGVLVPKGWFRFKQHVNVEFNEPARLPEEMSSYNTWQKVLKDIQLTAAPTIFVFSPMCANFHTLDVIILYWMDKKLIDVYGYQLKAGRKTPGPESIAPTADIKAKYRGTRHVQSFWVNGTPPLTKRVIKGWSQESEEAIDQFFGESGRYWTPAHWAALLATP